MLSPAEWNGVNTLVDYYLMPAEEDLVFIVYTSATLEEASWLKVALEMRDIEARMVWMLPLRDPEFSARFSSALPDASFRGNLLVVTLERETLSHDEVLRDRLALYAPERVKVFRAISASGLLFSHGLAVLPGELSRRNVALLERLMPASSVRVRSRSGTDLRISFDPKYRWISNRGIWQPGKSIILPPGEVATYPRSVDGVFVADFAFNANIHTDRDVRLVAHPVTVWVENGRATDFRCDDPSLRSFLDECFHRDCSRRVGEVGFGTNSGVLEPVPLNSHLNERHPGLHLGFGESNQPPDVVGYECNIHLDLVCTGGEVLFDNATSLDLLNLTSSDSPHPTQTRDEDAFSTDGSGGLDSDDCCGILRS